MGIKLRAQPRLKFFNLDGTACQNGKLYTYIPGTTDNKATYQDKDGSVAHANPIILDGNGEKVIWWNGVYDLRLDNEDDVQQWTQPDYGEGEDTVNYGNYNKVKDGGFEDDSNGDSLPDQWTVTEYPTAGSGAGVAVIDTTDQIEGAQSLKFTSSGDGGGYAVSAFFEVTEGEILYLSWMQKSSAADVRNVVEIIWYTSAQVQISTTSLYDDSTTNPTSWTLQTANATPPSTARYGKIRVTGCHSSDATTGSTWFDNVVCIDTVQTVIQLLGYTPVDDSGDTMTGALIMNTAGGTNASIGETGIDKSSGSAETFNIQNSGAGAMTLQVDGNAVLTSADESSLDVANAATLQNQNSAYHLSRANHTGTQTLSTISDSGALAALATITSGAYISWGSSANAGIAQGSQDIVGTTTSSSYNTVDSFLVYIDSNWSTLSYYVHPVQDMITASQEGYIRLTATATGTEVYFSYLSDSVDFKGVGTIDVSSESGWTTINVQARKTGGTSNWGCTRIAWAITA